jgi:putative MATE family efflux protein
MNAPLDSAPALMPRDAAPPNAARPKLLAGPIAPQLLRLALPVLVVLSMQTLVGVAETYFVSRLGTAAVAGVALVFPVFMLMTMMSNGGIGGGVSSAVARALGAGRIDDAHALVLHSVIIAVVFGAAFSLGIWTFGKALFGFLGATDDTLVNALLYANVLFGAAIPGWIANVLGAALRGGGNVRVPAIVTAAGAVTTLALSPLFIFGWGFVPGLGVAGAGVALIIFNVGSMAALAVYTRSRHSPVHLRLARLEIRLFKDILRVGLVSAVGTIVANLTVVAASGFVGAFGRDAIAGYGLASRLDYILIPLLFAIGTASVTMVGTNIGAGQLAHARRIAWTAALISVIATESIGLTAALSPEAWIHLFSREPEVVRVGTAYLVRVAPFYAFTGLGMALYFASQGAARMTWPFLAGVLRLAAVIGLGWYCVVATHGSLTQLFWIVAGSQLIFGGINAIGIATGWGGGAPREETSSSARPPEPAPGVTS